MPDVNITRVNQVPYSWTSCSHYFAGFPYKGILEANFKETREVEVVTAAQQDGVPLGITSGLYKIESLSWTLLQDSAYALMQDLAVLGAGSYGDATFNYLLQTYEPVTPTSTPQSTLITGCRITGVEEKKAKGVEALVTMFTAQALYLVRAPGLSLFSAVRQLL